MFSCVVLYLQVLTIRKAQSAGVYCIGQFTSNTLIYATLAQNASYNSLSVCTLGVDLNFLPTPLHHPKKPKHFFFFFPKSLPLSFSFSPLPSQTLSKPQANYSRELYFAFQAAEPQRAGLSLAIVLPGMPPSLTFAFPLRLLHNAVPALPACGHCEPGRAAACASSAGPPALPLPQRAPGRRDMWVSGLAVPEPKHFGTAKNTHSLTAGAARASQHPPLSFSRPYRSDSRVLHN